MKKIIYILLISTGSFVACKPKADLKTDKEVVSLTDSTFYNSNYLSDTGAIADPDEFINSGAVISGKATVADAAPAKSSSGSGGSGGTSGSSSQGSSSSSGSSTASTSTTKKTGISKAAQGAIIGGVGGAVTGAVIGKSGKGAAIGGAIGAVGGYIIGRSKDKKDGRY